MLARLALLAALAAPTPDETIFDGRSLKGWRREGGAPVELRRDGSLRTGPGDGRLGLLWYARRRYRDFSLRLRFRAAEGANRIGSPVSGTSAPSSTRTEASASRRIAP